MAQQSRPSQGYYGITVQVPTTSPASRLIDLVNAQQGIVLPPDVREYQLQLDPEDTSGNSIRLGTGSVGMSVGSPATTQKGLTLEDGGSTSDTSRSGNTIGTSFGLLYVQAVGGTRNLNIQVWL